MKTFRVLLEGANEGANKSAAIKANEFALRNEGTKANPFYVYRFVGGDGERVAELQASKVLSIIDAAALQSDKGKK
jgi:hypothetical protein